MSDLWTEKFKFQHRLQGMVNGIGEEIAEALEGALETVTGKIILLETKTKHAESLARRRKYMTQQRDQIEAVLHDVDSEIGNEIKGKAIETAKATPEIIDSMIKKTIPSEIKIQLGVPNLEKKRVAAWFDSSRVEGLYFNEWLKKLESNAVARIINETRQSRILSESLRETAKRLQGALDIGRKSAQGLAHNALHQAYIWSEREYLLQNANSFKALRYVAELDRRTTPLCRTLDGQEFPIREAPLPPLHWKCRSHIIPIFKNEKLEKYISRTDIRIARIDTEPRTVKHRDGTRSTTYEKLRVKHPLASQNYNQWLTSMAKSSDPRDVAFAREVLGPTRFDLVAKGKLKMESLYYTGKLRTIDELKRLMK